MKKTRRMAYSRRIREPGFMRSDLPGDANLDGSVDASDFNVWNSNRFRPDAGWCSGDFTSDGAVDVGDFNI